MPLAIHLIGAMIFFIVTLYAEQRRGNVTEATPYFVFMGLVVSLFWPVLLIFWALAWVDNKLHKPKPPKDWLDRP